MHPRGCLNNAKNSRAGGILDALTSARNLSQQVHEHRHSTDRRRQGTSRDICTQIYPNMIGLLYSSKWLDRAIVSRSVLYTAPLSAKIISSIFHSIASGICFYLFGKQLNTLISSTGDDVNEFLAKGITAARRPTGMLYIKGRMLLENIAVDSRRF